MSGTTNVPLVEKTSSASGVKGPFAASPIIFAFMRGALSPSITFSSAAGIRMSHSSSRASVVNLRFVPPGKFNIVSFAVLC